jgi:hypothetical protein
MRSQPSVALLIVLLLLTAGTVTGSFAEEPGPGLRLAWKHSFDGTIQGISADSGADCFAVLTNRDLSVWTYAGELRWRRDFAALGRWFRASKVAVAPSCDLAVVVGDSSYHYGWIFRRDGSRRHFATPGTPLAVAIAPAGDLIAVGTAAGRLSLVSPKGASVATRKVEGILNALEFSADGHLLVTDNIMGPGIYSQTGEPVWSAEGWWLSTSADLAGKVSWRVPPHFSSLGQVTFYGPDGQEAWGRAVYNPEARISRDGTAVAIVGLLDEGGVDTGPAGGAPVEIAQNRLYIFDPAGAVKASVPAPGQSLVGISENGRTLLLQDHRGMMRLYSEAGELRQELQVCSQDGCPVLARRGLEHVLVTEGPFLQVFSGQ